MPPQKENDQTTKKVEESFGPLIAIIIIVTVIIIGGLYILNKNNPRNLLPGNDLAKDPVIRSLGSQNSSDELDSIRKDLSAISINALYEDLGSISSAR